MPTVPTRNQPSVQIRPDSTPFQNTRGATLDAFGAGTGRALEAGARGLQQTADRLERESDALNSELVKAAQRVQLRKNGVSRAVDFKNYDAGVRTLTTDFKFGNPNDQTNQENVAKGLRELKDKILAGHTGDETSKALLQIRIEAAESAAKGQISEATLQAGRDAVTRDIEDSFKTSIVPGVIDFLQQTGEMPIFNSIQEMFDEKDLVIEQHENGMTPEEQAVAKDVGDVLIIETLYSTLRDMGEQEEAQKLLDSKLAVSILSEKRLNELEKELREAESTAEFTTLKPGEELFKDGVLIASGAPIAQKPLVVAKGASVLLGGEFLRPVAPAANDLQSDMRGEDGILNVKTQRLIQDVVSQLIGEPVGEVFAVGSENREVAIAMEVFMVKALDAGEVNTVPEAKELAAKEFADAIKDKKTLAGLARDIVERPFKAVKIDAASEPLSKLDVADGEQKLQKSAIDLRDAGGPASAFFNAINNTLGIGLEGAISQEVVKARVRKNLLKQKFIVAMLKSPRAPIWEQKILGDIFGDSSFWEAPLASKAKLEAIDGVIALSIHADLEVLEAGVFRENPQHEQELFSRIVAMKDLRNGIAEFLPQEAQEAKEEVSEADEPVVSVEQIRAGIATKEQGIAFNNSLSEEDRAALPIEDLRALGELIIEPPKTALELFDELKKGEPAKKKNPDKVDNAFGLREDGTEKDIGFLGLLKRPDGRVSSELSISVEVDGEELFIPTLVPGLTKKEIEFLLNLQDGEAKTIPDSIIDKAIKHALKRKKQGKSPFFKSGE